MAMDGGISDAHEVKGLAGVFFPTLERCLDNVSSNKNLLRSHLYGRNLTSMRSRQFT